jgi:hypothetical protein
LSGLAFAGANKRQSARWAEDDGILTAEEIASLDLHGVEWAVLSACDTGVGEIKAGEGVFGLRRAFQVAGARTVIMSLWSVEDRATREWMAALYRERFANRPARARIRSTGRDLSPRATGGEPDCATDPRTTPHGFADVLGEPRSGYAVTPRPEQGALRQEDMR